MPFDFVMSHSEDDLQKLETLFIEPLTDKILAVYKEPQNIYKTELKKPNMK
jgi:hypothetical protein